MSAALLTAVAVAAALLLAVVVVAAALLPVVVVVAAAALLPVVVVVAAAALLLREWSPLRCCSTASGGLLQEDPLPPSRVHLCRLPFSRLSEAFHCIGICKIPDLQSVVLVETCFLLARGLLEIPAVCKTD